MAFGHFLLGSHNCMVTALGLCVKWLFENFGRASPRRVAMHAWCPRRKNKEPGAGTWNNVFAKQGTLMRIGKLGWVFPHAQKWGRKRKKHQRNLSKGKFKGMGDPPSADNTSWRHPFRFQATLVSECLSKPRHT